MGKFTKVTESLVRRIKKLVDYGLSSGMGDRGRGEMCVQACVMAALEEEHGDQPNSCVPQNRIDFGIAMNDMYGWDSAEARGKGLKRYAIAELGNSTKPEEAFDGLVLTQL